MACPGLAFHDWATEQKLTRTSDLAELRGAYVAIDADDYVDRLLTDASSREPLLPALGGLPMGIKKWVNAHLDIFHDLDITPRFVFNGLEIASRDRVAISRETQKTADSLNEAWSLYGQNRADAAVEEFGKSCTYRTHGVRRWLSQYLVKKGVSSSFATYSAAAQTVYWKYQLKKNADALAGGIDILVFGGEKVITTFDWDARTFSWTTAELVRAKLGVTQDQFIDLSLLSGLSLLPPIDEVVESSQRAIDSARNVLGRANFDGLLASSASKNDQYQALYKKARAAVKHIPVLKAGGKLEPLHYSDTVDNLHECVGRRLPDEVLYYASRGFTDSKILNTRTQMELYEAVPLDGGNSQTYRDLVQQKLATIHQQGLAILSRKLHRYYSRQDISLVCWFNEAAKNQLGIPDAIAALDKSADQWLVTDDTLTSLSTQTHASVEDSPLSYTIAALRNDADAKKTVSASSGTVLKSSDEFLANSTWRFLQGRGYINESHQLTAWGKAYHKAIEQAHSNGYMDAAISQSEAEEAIFMALELARLDLLNGTPMFTSPLYSGAPSRGSETDKANTNLISRVACLATFRHRELGFTGPLSRHLLAYQQIAAAVRNSLRSLLEMYAMDMLLSATFSRDITPKQWSEYGARLPLLKEPDLGLALVVKSFLDELSNEPARRADITRWFPQTLDIHSDLDMAWKLWDSVNTGIQAAEGVPTSTKTNFKEADAWLKQKLSDSKPLTNGVS